jgi:uncharacterized membrane protein
MAPLGAPTLGEEPAPDWEYILAHHVPSRYSRTLAVRLRGRWYHLCARCSGQVVGALAYLVLFVLSAATRTLLFDPRVEWAFALFPLLAAVDWFTQAIGPRESTNGLRLLSGALLGFAAFDVLALLLTGRWFLLAGALLIVAVYLAGLALALRITGAWRRVLEEHLPGITLEGPG